MSPEQSTIFNQQSSQGRLVELVALRRVAPRAAAQDYSRDLLRSVPPLDAPAAPEATSPMTDAAGTVIEGLFGAHAFRRREGAAELSQPRQPPPVRRLDRKIS